MATTEQVAQLIQIMQQQNEMLIAQRTGAGADVEANAGGEPARNSKARKPDRPVVNADIDDREWALFEDTWSRYKDWVGGNVASIRSELRFACSPEVNKMLFEFVGPQTLNTCTETELLAHIKSIAVKQVHHEVHQMTFHGMFQQEGESVTRWCARLKAQAFLCQFETQCPCTPATVVSYADKMVAQRLVAGLCNLEHQRKILADAATLTTLDSKVKRLQLLETTEQSAELLHQSSKFKPSEAAAQRSQYKKMQGPRRGGGGGNIVHVYCVD